MSDYTLEEFLADCLREIPGCPEPVDCVEKTAPFMFALLNGDKTFLKPEHLQSDPQSYARNAIHIDGSGTLSLYALVWLPGQCTPIHDHGTWGVVGVVEGTLEEHPFIRVDGQDQSAMEEIQLARGGSILLAPGSVTSFVPNPDHIHLAGNTGTQDRLVSLHLYGRAMSNFNIYDRVSGTRERVEVSHNES